MAQQNTIKILFFLLFLTIQPGIIWAQNDKRGIALVVNNYNYSSADYRLPFTNDGDTVARHLKNLGFDIITSKNESSTQLRTKIKFFTDRAKKYKNVIFYYTGHISGISTLSETDNYIIPVNVDPSKVSKQLSECISLSTIVDLIQSDDTPKTTMLYINGNHNDRLLAIPTDYKNSWAIFSLTPYFPNNNQDLTVSPFSDAFLYSSKQPGLELNDMGMYLSAYLRQKTDGNANTAIYSSLSTDYIFIDDALNEDITTYENGQNKLDKQFNLAETYYQSGLEYKYAINKKLDNKKAMEAFVKAAELGHPDAANLVGEHYRYGMGTTRSLKAALAFFNYAADLGSSEALVNLALYYWGDYSNKTDKELAINYLYRAAALANGNAYYELGKIYSDGIYVERDEIKALSYYARGAELGGNKALHYMATYEMKKGNCDKAAEYYEKAVWQNHTESIFDYAALLIEGCSTHHNPARGMELLQKTIKMEYTPAYRYMGYIYENGLANIAIDNKKAIQWYQKSYDIDHDNYSLKRIKKLKSQ